MLKRQGDTTLSDEEAESKATTGTWVSENDSYFNPL